MKKIFITVFLLSTLSLFSQTANDYYKEAKQLADRDIKHYNVPKKLKKAIALDSTNAKYYALYGKYSINKKQYDNAILLYKKAIKLDSTNMEYYWLLSKAILNESTRSYGITDDSIFEGLAILNTMISKGAKSVKVYERIATANQFVLDDYYNRYKNFKLPKTESWQDDKVDTSEKKRFKEVSLNAYNNIITYCNFILKLDLDNEFAKSKLKYLKKPIF